MTLLKTMPPDRQNLSYDIYDLDDRLLLLASDRVAVFGQVLPDLIPNKGRALTQLSIFWYELMESIIDTHFLSADIADLPECFQPFANELEGRSILVKKLEEYPITAEVNGYLTSRLLAEYEQNGTVGGVEASSGLQLNSLLEQCIYIPYLEDSISQTAAAAEGRASTVGESSASLPITLDDSSVQSNLGQQIDLTRTVELFGTRDAMVMCSNALDLYEIAHGLARSRGIIFADLQLRFGKQDNQIILTAVPNPDTSSLWSAANYQVGIEQSAYIQQTLIDWYSTNWDHQSVLPALPHEIIQTIEQAYIQTFELISSEQFVV